MPVNVKGGAVKIISRTHSVVASVWCGTEAVAHDVDL